MATTAKKKFVRTDVPRTERATSVAILVLLAGIAVAVAVKGRNYDPHRFALDPAALAATQSTVAPDDPSLNAIPVASATAQNAEPAAPGAATPSGTIAELRLPVEGLSPLGPTEAYSPETLYEKIDGQAEGYLAFHFVHMRCRSFGIDGSAGAYIDVYRYDMGEPVNAYGIYSAERDATAPAIDFASDGYRSAMGYFFRQGKYYVQVLASDMKPETMAAAEKAARAMADSLHADDTGLEGMRSLPAGYDPSSMSFSLADAFGIPGLANAYQADYPFEGEKLTFFIAREADEAAAAKAYDAFRGFAAQFGTAEDLPEAGGARRFATESFGQWKVIYQRGTEVGGAVDAPARAGAEQFVEQYLGGTLKLPAFKAEPAAAGDPGADPESNPEAGYDAMGGDPENNF